MKELNALIHTRECNTIQIIRNLKIKIEINEQIFEALVNSKVISNFMFKSLIRKQRFETIKLKEAHYLLMMNKEKLKNQITKKIKSLRMTIQQHHEEINFEVVSMITHDIVLNMFWLKLHNSNVNGKKKVFTFKKCECVIDIKLVHRQRLMINEEHELSFTKYSITNKNDFERRFASTDIEQGQSNQEIKNEKKNYAPSKYLDKFERSKEKVKRVLKKIRSLKNISNEYKNWKHLFREEMTTKTLLKH